MSLLTLILAAICNSLRYTGQLKNESRRTATLSLTFHHIIDKYMKYIL